MPMIKSQIMFWKGNLHKYVHIHTYVHMSKTLYQNTIFELGIGTASLFSGMTPNAFWKRALYIYKQKAGCECTLLSELPHQSATTQYPSRPQCGMFSCPCQKVTVPKVRLAPNESLASDLFMFSSSSRRLGKQLKSIRHAPHFKQVGRLQSTIVKVGRAYP